MKMQWYTLNIKPSNQKKIAEGLTRKKIESYFPVISNSKTPSNEYKVFVEPIFPHYIFIKTLESDLKDIKKIPGVVNLVYWLGKPVIISEYEIKLLKRFLNENYNVHSEKINLRDKSVLNFVESISDAEELLLSTSNKKVKLLLPSLGYLVNGEFEPSKIRIITSNNLVHQAKTEMPRFFNPVHTFYNFFKN